MQTANNIQPFDAGTGSSRLSKPFTFLLLMGGLLLVAVVTAKMQIMGVGLLFGVCCVLIYGYLLFINPVYGLYTAVMLGFTLIGMGRYLKDVQVGLGMDAILLMTYLALIMNRFREKVDWSPVNKDITYLALIWFAYSVFEIVNPEARSMAAWFSGRGMSMYMLLIVPLTLLLINNHRRMDILLTIWGVFSILATLKGIMQLKMGLDGAEQAWLDEGNYKTHILFGKLRVFSFMSDAGQFGANQAYNAVVAFIYAKSVKGKLRMFFNTVAILGLYGMIISGTRGAISVPLAGLMTFFVLRKNIRVLSIGVAVLALVFVFFKYTTIGQGNDQIRRMRTAFDPNDASLQVRLDNQRILKGYLASRPFGGGVGHGGVKAQKYLPNAFLSQVATDSWYVLIWVELGAIGLTLHLFILFYILAKSSYAVMFKIRDPQLRLKITAMVAGMAGVMAASYGNAILGGMPTAVTLYISMALMLNTKALDTKEDQSDVTTTNVNG